VVEQGCEADDLIGVCPPAKNACQFGISCLLTGFADRAEIEIVPIKSEFLTLHTVP
jgi:hypothetical protein